MTQTDIDLLPAHPQDSTLLIGDLNAHSPLLSFKDFTNSHGRLISSFLDNSDFSLISSPDPTHSSFSQDSDPCRLDLTLANSSILPYIKDCSVGKDLGSDHLPIIVTVNFLLQETPRTPRTTPDFPRADWDRFQLTLDTCLPDSLSISSTDDIPKAAQVITEAIQIAQDDAIPILTAKTSRPYSISQTTLSLIKKRRATRRKYHLTKAPCLKKALIKLNQEISSQLKLDSDNYWDNYCNSLDEETDPKSFWKLFKRIGKPNNNSSRPLHHENITTTTPQGKANIFAASLGATMSCPPYSLSPEAPEEEQELDLLISSYSPSKVEYNEPPHEVLSPITVEEIIKTILPLPNKTPGPDMIYNKALQKGTFKLFELLAELYNSCLKYRYFPPAWKEALVAMIPKPDKDLSKPSSYRPISLLSVLGKTLERIITDRLAFFLESNGILHAAQAGFRRSKCTSDQLVRLQNDILNAANKNIPLLALFFDVEKAFDRVWHRGLLYKLRFSYNLPLDLVAFVESYLSDRTLKVRVEGATSQSFSISAGVPQGSVLAPLLFLLYVNDLPLCLPQGATISQFADDTAIWIQSNLRARLGKIPTIAQEALDCIHKYSSKWRISMNPTKSTALLFAFNKLDPPHLTLGGKTIPYSPHVKFLGLTFQSNFYWTKHIQLIKCKAKRKLNCLKIISGTNRCNPATILHLYKTFIRPVITYGHAAWANCSDSAFLSLQRVETAAIRYALRLPCFVSKKYIYHQSKIEPLPQYASKLALKYLDDVKRPDDISLIRSTTNKKIGFKNHKRVRTYPVYNLIRRAEDGQSSHLPLIQQHSWPTTHYSDIA
jgi:hypothetical protein